MAFCVWHNVFKIHLHCSIYQNFIFYSWKIHCMDRSHFFIHLSLDEHQDCFQFFTIVANAMNICVQVFVWTYVFSSLGYI